MKSINRILLDNFIESEKREEVHSEEYIRDISVAQTFEQLVEKVRQWMPNQTAAQATHYVLVTLSNKKFTP